MSMKQRNIKKNNLLNQAINAMKKRSVYECAEYCYRNGLDIRTFKRTGFVETPTRFVFSNKSWYEYFKNQ